MGRRPKGRWSTPSWPRFTGRIAAVEVWTRSQDARRVHTDDADVGESVVAAKEGAFQELGEIVVTAANYQQASEKALAALRNIRVGIRQKGKVVWQTADYLQTP